jgi:hypothetical protein
MGKAPRAAAASLPVRFEESGPMRPLDGASVQLLPAVLGELRTGSRGDILGPDSPEHDEARPSGAEWWTGVLR